MKKKKSNGMILITTMLFITIIVMLATLIAVQGKSALQNGNLSLQSEQAYLAALSGIDYVRGELRKNRNFGTADFSQTAPSSPVNGLFVQYNDRNLTGYLGYNSANNYKSKFSVSFNNPNQTNTTNESYKHTSSDCKYLSVNNLNTVSSVPKNLSNGIRRDVPGSSVYIVSKGVSGKSVRYVETFLTSDSSPTIDGGTTIGGDIKITGSAGNYSIGSPNQNYTNRNSLLTVKHINDNAIGKLTAFDPLDTEGTAKKNISIKSENNANDVYALLNLTTPVQFNGTLNINNGSTIYKTSDIDKPSDGYLQELLSKITVNPEATVDTEDLKKLTYDEAQNIVGSTTDGENGTNNSNNNTNSYTLATGTYAYIRDPNREDDGPKAYWKFINKTDPASVLVALNNNDSSVVDIGPTIATGGISFGLNSPKPADYESRTVNLFGNLHSQGAVNFLMILKEDSVTHKFINSSVDFSINGGSLISDGDININGEVVGHGNLISNGDISFNAGSELEVDENQKVAVWARGDINIRQATNVSNDRSVELMDITNNNATTGGDTAGEGNNLPSSNDLSDILMGRVGDVVRDKVGFELPVTFVEGNPISNNRYCNFTYNGTTYGFVYQTSSVSGSNGVVWKIWKNGNWNGNDVFTDTGFNRSGSFWSDDNIFVQIKKPRNGDNNYDDFNVFLIADDGTYYYYKTVDIHSQQSIVKYDPNNVGELPSSIPTNKYVSDFDRFPKTRSSDYANEPTALSNLSTSSRDIFIKIFNEKNTSLRGTVYSAEGKIDINAGDNDFKIVGALITTNGDLDIKAKHVNLIYDPNYVPFFRDAGGVETNVGFVSSFIGGE